MNILWLLHLLLCFVHQPPRVTIPQCIAQANPVYRAWLVSHHLTCP
jgi:hypothetical protein